MEALYRMWSNTRGQLSWISHALSGCPEFSFADFPCRQVTMGMQRSMPEDETKNIRTWYVRLSWTHLHRRTHHACTGLLCGVQDVSGPH